MMLFIFVLLFFHSFFFHSLLSVRSIFLPIHPFVFFTPHQCDVHLHAHFPPLSHVMARVETDNHFNVVASLSLYLAHATLMHSC
mmetsp:Transcript_4050/g.7852  ORF Transcript_4050/g.7852 Transcript_4050/m.7852 type:complete len:84 (-) Transcript_4050:810-1061(-)